MAKTIMFVDDEKQILRSLNRLFMDSPYETVFMESGDEALVYLGSNRVDLIVSDIRMPGMNGFDLLKWVKANHPDTMRVALSGYTDSRNIFKALEENLAKMYLFKPWDNRELLSVVDRMFQLEEVLQDRKVMDLINNLDELPTVPALYSRIKQMILDDEDVDRIAHLIESDQASSSKILRIANSAFYGAKTGSIGQAIMYIGLMNVKSIVLSNSVFRIEGPGAEIIKHLWQNATLTNRFTSQIYQNFLGKKIPNIFASAGLLHNIGMVVLASHYPQKYTGLLQEINQSRQSVCAGEQAMLGVTHQELGGYLLNWWEIPLPIVEAALFHHTPMDPRVLNRELVCAVHIAAAEAWKKLGHEYLTESFEPGCYEFLNIDPAAAEAFFRNQEVTPGLLD